MTQALKFEPMHVHPEAPTPVLCHRLVPVGGSAVTPSRAGPVSELFARMLTSQPALPWMVSCLPEQLSHTCLVAKPSGARWCRRTACLPFKSAASELWGLRSIGFVQRSAGPSPGLASSPAITDFLLLTLTLPSTALVLHIGGGR